MKDIFDPRSYGAMADGHSKDTATVQAAIDAAAAQGGTVRLAGGTFVCGTLYLKSNVALEITNSTTLLAATFMSAVSSTYFILAPECLGGLLNAKTAEGTTIYNTAVAYPIGIIFAIAMLAVFLHATKKAAQKA